MKTAGRTATVRVDDLFQAAYLLVAGCTLVGTTKTEEGFTAFLFSDADDRASRTLMDYLNGLAQVEPRRFAEAWRTLRNLCRG